MGEGDIVAVYETFRRIDALRGGQLVTADQLEYCLTATVRVTDWCHSKFPADCHFRRRRQCGGVRAALWHCSR